MTQQLFSENRESSMPNTGRLSHRNQLSIRRNYSQKMSATQPIPCNKRVLKLV